MTRKPFVSKDQTRVLVPPRLATVESEEVKREQVERLMAPVKPRPQGNPAIVSLWPGKLIVPDAPSGATYEWPDGGSKVEVAVEDVDFVMSRNRGGNRGCCGSGGRRIYFEIAD